MMDLGSLVPFLLAAHISLAIALFLPSLLLPFTMRAARRGPISVASGGTISRSLLWLQRNGTLVIGAGLALTGLALVAVLGTQLLAQPWLLVALVLYLANIGLAFFVQRPGVARLIRLRGETSEAAVERWRSWARRQRYVSYLMAALIGAIGFLMMTKPQL